MGFKLHRSCAWVLLFVALPFLAFAGKTVSPLQDTCSNAAFNKTLAYMAQGLVFFLSDDTNCVEKATSSLQKALQEDPENTEAYILLHDIYVQNDDLENATRALLRYLELSNKPDRCLEALADAFRTKNPELIWEAFQIEKRLRPSSRNRETLICIYFETIPELAACHSYRKALSIYREMISLWRKNPLLFGPENSPAILLPVIVSQICADFFGDAPGSRKRGIWERFWKRTQANWYIKKFSNALYKAEFHKNPKRRDEIYKALESSAFVLLDHTDHLPVTKELLCRSFALSTENIRVFRALEKFLGDKQAPEDFAEKGNFLSEHESRAFCAHIRFYRGIFRALDLPSEEEQKKALLKAAEELASCPLRTPCYPSADWFLTLVRLSVTPENDNYQQIRKILELGLSIHPDDLTLRKLFVLCSPEDSRGEALEMITEALRKDPLNYQLLYALGNILLNMNQYQDAIATLALSAHLGAGEEHFYPIAHDLATVFRVLGQEELAEKWQQKAARALAEKEEIPSPETPSGIDSVLKFLSLFPEDQRCNTFREYIFK